MALVDGLATVSTLLDRASRKVLLLLMSVETIIVIVAVIARYGFSSSFAWSDEVARAILTWIVLLGAASALKSNELVALLSIREAGSDGMVLGLRLLCEVVIIAFSMVMIYATIKLMGLTVRQTFPVTGWPVWSAYLALPVAGCLITLHSLSRCFDLLRGRESVRIEFEAGDAA
jgi:C4-dicarboxylate transporter DctQ subunit